MLGINNLDKQGTIAFEAPTDPLNPVFISSKGPGAAMQADDSDDSDSDRERRLVTRKSAISTVPAKQPGEKRVSMHSS